MLQCVCSGFWAAWVLFNDIIYPSAVNNVIPVFINHVSHTTPIFFVFIELCLCYHATPRVKPAIASLVTVETIYLFTWAIVYNILIYYYCRFSITRTSWGIKINSHCVFSSWCYIPQTQIRNVKSLQGERKKFE